MIIIVNDVQSIVKLKEFFSRKFEIKNLSLLSHFLGFEVIFDAPSYYLSQTKYAINLLFWIPLTGNKIASIPIEPNVKFARINSTPFYDTSFYLLLIDSLICLTIIHSNIVYAIYVGSQFMSAPYTTHVAVVLWILYYIKDILFHSLYFSAHFFTWVECLFYYTLGRWFYWSLWQVIVYFLMIFLFHGVARNR